MPSWTAPPGAKERSIMGRVAGDKSRFNKQRRQKIAKRAAMRALRKSWGEKAAAAPKATAAR